MSEPPTKALVRKDDLTLTRIRRPQAPLHDVGTGPSLSRNDFLYALFKHKKKILFGAIVGLAAAVAVYFYYPAGLAVAVSTLAARAAAAARPAAREA